METKETIEVLNNLIEINNDRIEGYKTAAKETKDPHLKTLFRKFMETSEMCKSQLIKEVKFLKGEPAEGTRVTGKFFRTWMDLKAALTGNDKKSILENCEYGEDVMKENYEAAMNGNNHVLSMIHLGLLNGQYLLLKAEHDQVKSMRDEVA